MEQAEEERHAEFRAWFRKRFKRKPVDGDEDRYWDYFEAMMLEEHS
jgi:hypothetical protein